MGSTRSLSTGKKALHFTEFGIFVFSRVLVCPTLWPQLLSLIWGFTSNFWTGLFSNKLQPRPPSDHRYSCSHYIKHAGGHDLQLNWGQGFYSGQIALMKIHVHKRHLQSTASEWKQTVTEIFSISLSKVYFYISAYIRVTTEDIASKICRSLFSKVHKFCRSRFKFGYSAVAFEPPLHPEDKSFTMDLLFVTIILQWILWNKRSTDIYSWFAYGYQRSGSGETARHVTNY